MMGVDGEAAQSRQYSSGFLCDEMRQETVKVPACTSERKMGQRLRQYAKFVVRLGSPCRPFRRHQFIDACGHMCEVSVLAQIESLMPVDRVP